MADSYYPRPPPTGPEIERLSASFAKLFRSADGLSVSGGGFPGIHNNQYASHHQHNDNVITRQPFGGSQISNSSVVGGIPMTFMCPPSMSPPPPHPQNMMNHHQHNNQHPNQHSNQHSNQNPQQPLLLNAQVGIPLPGLDVLDRVPYIKVTDAGIFSGSYTCSPGYKIFSLQGDSMLRGSTSKLFCPFDSKMKTVRIKDLNDDCLFQVKFTPSICECDSEEKRCFAVFSPLYENPFGAILFEAGQLKYSLRILNALEGETFAVQFMNETDVSIKGADGTIVALISIQKKRGESKKYTLTFTEEISSANKALFIACILTLDLVNCEATCSKCICLTPIVFACLTIFGLTLASYWDNKPNHNPKP